MKGLPMVAREHARHSRFSGRDSSSIAETFQRDGFITGIRVLEPDAAHATLDRIEEFERVHRGDLPVHEMFRTGTHIVMRTVDEMIRHPRVLDVVRTLLGPNLIVWDSDIIIKEPRTEGFVSWHQDLRYWGVDSHDAVTVWIALTDATGAMGCMRFLPGSHRAGLIDHEDTFETGNLLTRGQNVRWTIDESRTRYGELSAGEMSVHHGLTMHASEPNRSSARRVGLVIRFATPAMQQVVAERDYAQLVCGTDAFDHFVPVPRPRTDAAPEAVALWRKISEDRAGAYFSGVKEGNRRWTGGDTEGRA